MSAFCSDTLASAATLDAVDSGSQMAASSSRTQPYKSTKASNRVAKSWPEVHFDLLANVQGKIGTVAGRNTRG